MKPGTGPAPVLLLVDAMTIASPLLTWSMTLA